MFRGLSIIPDCCNFTRFYQETGIRVFTGFERVQAKRGEGCVEACIYRNRMFGKLKERRWRKRLGRALKKQSGSRAIEPWAHIRKIAVYCHEEAGMDKAKILASARKIAQGKELSLLVYSDSKDLASVADSWGGLWKSCCVIGRKDLRFSYFPKLKNPEVAAFFQDSYDLLLDLSPQSRFMDIAVLASVKAGFKVGKSSEWGKEVNDLSLALNDTKNPLDEILRLLDAYLPFIGLAQDRLQREIQREIEVDNEKKNGKGAVSGKPGNPIPSK